MIDVLGRIRNEHKLTTRTALVGPEAKHLDTTMQTERRSLDEIGRWMVLKRPSKKKELHYKFFRKTIRGNQGHEKCKMQIGKIGDEKHDHEEEVFSPVKDFTVVESI